MFQIIYFPRILVYLLFHVFDFQGDLLDFYGNVFDPSI